MNNVYICLCLLSTHVLVYAMLKQCFDLFSQVAPAKFYANEKHCNKRNENQLILI